MPSPFPGMDPFIEGQCWKGFHHSFISEIQFVLTQQLRPRYVVDIEESVYLARENGDPVRLIVPDVSVRQVKGWLESVDGGLAIKVEPHVVTLPMTEPVEIPYLVIRKRDHDQTVTVIEVLSPTNKAARDGRTEYLAKRNALLRSQSHLVELDLLRGGERLPTVEPLPVGDYFAFVSEISHRPQASVYAWLLNQPLPTIPIPLAEGDPAGQLDLQAVFTSTYDRAGYDYSLNYDRPVEPPFDESHRTWVQRILSGAP